MANGAAKEFAGAVKVTHQAPTRESFNGVVDDPETQVSSDRAPADDLIEQ